jgi:serine/threonine protein kinase
MPPGGDQTAAAGDGVAAGDSVASAASVDPFSPQHPNVARLFDGGVTAQGEPYFVMEYVEGDPSDVYCERTNASIAKRVDVFCRVCDAVQAAHRALVVHRDIKPGNILVHGDGTPKLLDFGIAKMLTPEPGFDEAEQTIGAAPDDAGLRAPSRSAASR